MTTLPKLHSQSTCLAGQSAMSSLYGPYPPKELSFYDTCSIPERVNPLAPLPPKHRINASWETTEQHWHNSSRSMLMQQREHMRYHSAWSKAYYGSTPEKEQYRKHFRDVLKQQMRDKCLKDKQTFMSNMKESKQALEIDQNDIYADAHNNLQKHLYLTQYRNDNKSIMENKWRSATKNKTSTDLFDREALRYNPINWSKTLT